MLCLTAALTVLSPYPVLAANSTNEVAMENCGAYLFEWRPVDCGNGRAFAILVGGNN
ncbi:choline-binding protein, partial [Enterocloster hominis]